ncbi:Fatty acid amide hydrolase 1 [Schistosoma japonicum]|uniref:Fatty acid amide hydrolase 1 n=1 Tax=Schistosoma japonicum TaxID=6182 RepID=A0A4Z2CXZ4_SCHJA|nr:Fatty acid amide hydrolase 1 [Schistosoma japonicum]
MSHMKNTLSLFIDGLTIFYLLDSLTFYLCSTTLITSIRLILNLPTYYIFNYIFKKWIIFRCLLVFWRRYNVYKRLHKKRDDLLDKHGRLHIKLQGLHNMDGQCKMSSPNNNNELISLSVSQLREKLCSKTVTSVDLLDAYQIHCLELIRSRSNCISEIIYEADVYAILADNSRESEGARISSIYGIPIALEEVFPIRGYDHTMGYTICTNRVAEDDCILVKALRDCGAIPVILTNVKQKIFGLSANNPITGLTSHPTHPGRACISGTGPLLVHNGCPLAIGFDILGEARLSATFCGKTAFKPTPYRMSNKDLKLPIELPDYLSPVPSPVGHRIEDIVDVLRSIWTTNMFAHDCSLSPMPFNDKEYISNVKENRKLKIGYYSNFDGLLNSSPSVQRVMSNIRDELSKQGHEVVDFALPTPEKAYQLTISLLASYVEPELLKLLYIHGSGDILVDYKQRLLHLFYALPSFIRHRIAEWRAQNIENDYPATAIVLRGLGCNKSRKTLIAQINDYKQELFSAWNEAKLDLLVCPTSPIPAPWDDSPSYVTNCVLPFTCLYNLLGCPAGTVSVGRVEKCDLQACDNISNGNFKTSPLSMMFIEQHKHSEGLPIGVQVVAKPWNDELALGLLAKLQSIFTS